MSVNQGPLPGFEEFMYREQPSPVFLVYAVHAELREHLAYIFENEVKILRDMSRESADRIPTEMYVLQRKVVMSLKDLVNKVDDLNQFVEGMFHAK